MTLRETTPLMHALREISEVIDVPECGTTMRCSVIEDKSGALELAKAPKMRNRTKHIEIKHHHFRNFVEKGHNNFRYNRCDRTTS